VLGVLVAPLRPLRRDFPAYLFFPGSVGGWDIMAIASP
jgi:hypothetical protein